MSVNVINVKALNNNIVCQNDFIIKGRPKTYLNASVTANAGATITVFNIEGFSAGNYYGLIGNLGSGNAELIKLHASTAPTGNTITFASNVLKNHDANEPVWFVNYNQIVFSNATTVTGVKSTLATQSIDPTRLFTVYSSADADNLAVGFAFCQFKNAGSNEDTDFSAPAPYDNPVFNTVEYLINQSMIEAKQTEDGLPRFSEELTVDYLINQANECLRNIRKHKNKLSWTQSYKSVLGQTALGTFIYSLPSDIYDKYSRRAIERIAIGDRSELKYVDPDYFFNVVMNNVHYTQVTTAANAGDTTLEIDNSYDFDDSGSIYVGGQTITYTGVTRSATAGVLTGVPASGTGAITASISVDDYVFQNSTTGEPAYFTLLNGSLYVWNIPDSTWINKNITIDYFKTVTSVDSLEDAIDYIQFDLVKNWLVWKIRSIVKNDGVSALDDPNYLLYREDLAVLIKKDRNLNRKHFRNVYEFDDTDEDINGKRLRRGDARLI